MKRLARWLNGVTALFLLVATSARAADPAPQGSAGTSSASKGSAGRLIEVSALSASGVRRMLANVDLDRLPQRELTRRDPQYDAEVRLRGVTLEQVLGRAGVPADTDLALLRFNNGLVIPLAFRDAALMARLQPYLARAATLDPRARLVAGQVEDPHGPPTSEDLRPVRFAGNKLVVADAEHPAVLPTVTHDLRPWLYADSLASIELVDRAAWERQLDVDPATAQGLRVFLGSCRFCHAIRGTGGALGWDFVEPYAIYSDEWIRRMGKGEDELNPTPGRTRLSIHVRYRPEGAGRSMPALRSMRRDEVEALWAWLQVISVRPLRPYRKAAAALP